MTKHEAETIIARVDALHQISDDILSKYWKHIGLLVSPDILISSDSQIEASTAFLLLGLMMSCLAKGKDFEVCLADARSVLEKAREAAHSMKMAVN